MRAKRGVAILAALVLAPALLGPALAQEPERSKQPDRAQRQRELQERWKALTPEQRAELRKVHAAWLGDTTPEQRQKLREAARKRRDQRGPEAEAVRAKAKEKLSQVPQDEKAKFRQLVQRLIQKLPPEERARLTQLPREERRQAVQKLIREHRLEVLEHHLAALPQDQRERIRSDVQGVQGQERYARIRRQLESHVRTAARGILADRTLAPAERAQRIKELLRTLPPELRERLRAKLREEAERRDRGSDGQRPDGQRPDGQRPDGGKGPRPPRPRPPR